MAATPLRVTIAGANSERGWARDAHFPALAGLPDLAVHAASARTQEIADAVARAFGASKAYPDSLALARDPAIDIVVVIVIVIVIVKAPEQRAIHTGIRTVPDFDIAVRLTRLVEAIERASDEQHSLALSATGTWA